MPVDDVRFVIVAVAFGALVGWGLGRWAQDRRPSLWATALSVTAGVVAWITWSIVDTPGRSWGTAAVALSIGGASALIVLATTGRRPTSST